MRKQIELLEDHTRCGEDFTLTLIINIDTALNKCLTFDMNIALVYSFKVIDTAKHC